MARQPPARPTQERMVSPSQRSRKHGGGTAGRDLHAPSTLASWEHAAMRHCRPPQSEPTARPSADLWKRPGERLHINALPEAEVQRTSPDRTAPRDAACSERAFAAPRACKVGAETGAGARQTFMADEHA